jgi:hypothetical protein
MFSPISGDQLECAPQQSLGVSQALLRFAHGRTEVFASRWNAERSDLGELLPISLYVFGDHRQSGSDWVVHGLILAGRATKSSLPGWRHGRYRGHLCIW